MTALTFFSYISFIFSSEAMIYLCVVMIVSSLIYAYGRDIKLSQIFNRKKFAAFPDVLQAVFVIVKSTFLAAVVVTAAKHIFKIARPEHMLIVETGYRFPSGHATLSFAFCTAFVWSLYTYRNMRSSWLLLLLPVLISYSRLYLQVHRLIDVVVGAILGTLCTVVVVQSYKWYIRKV